MLLVSVIRVDLNWPELAGLFLCCYLYAVWNYAIPKILISSICTHWNLSTHMFRSYATWKIFSKMKYTANSINCLYFLVPIFHRWITFVLLHWNGNSQWNHLFYFGCVYWEEIQCFNLNETLNSICEQIVSDTWTISQESKAFPILHCNLSNYTIHWNSN